MKGQLPLSAEGLGGQGVEQFGRSAALVSGLDHQLFFLNHVHEFDTGEPASVPCAAWNDLNPNMGRVTRFTPR